MPKVVGLFPKKPRYSKRLMKLYTQPIKRKVAPQTKQYVKRTIRRQLETKYFDKKDETGEEISTTVAIQQLNGMANGTTDITRVGDRIDPLSLHSTLVVTHDNDSALSTLYRIVIFQMHSDVSPSSWLDVFDSASVFAQRHWDKRKEATVLWDSGVRAFGPSAQQYAGPTKYPGNKNIHILKCYVPGKRMRKCQYLAGGTTGFNDIFIMALSDRASGTEGVCSVKFHFRLKYKDG